MKTSILVLAIGATLLFCGIAFGDGVPAAVVSGGTHVFFTDSPGTVIGWEFTVTIPNCIPYLGYYDEGGDGLTDAHEVALFNGAGSLIASVTITSADPLIDGFRYAPIPALCFTPGETLIVAAYTLPSSPDLILANPTKELHPSTAFVTGRIEPSSPFTFPTTTTADVYFGANFLVFDDCLPGTVNDLTGPVSDVLYVNGSPGPNGHRTVNADEGSLLWCTILMPPAGGNGKYVIHANTGTPDGTTVSPLPANVGLGCFPFLLGAGATPVAVWNNIGKESLVGSSKYFDGSPLPNPAKAPAVYLQLSQGDATNLPAGTTVTFQGIIVDPGSTSPKTASTTNGVILNIL